MGFNISGVVISKNYQDDIESLEDILGITLNCSDVEEVTFKVASADHSVYDHECYIYFCPTGTLVFTQIELALPTYHIPQQQCASFVLWQSNDTMQLTLTQNGTVIRHIKEIAKTATSEVFGNPVEEDNGSEIFGAIKMVLGKSFFDISEDEILLNFFDID